MVVVGHIAEELALLRVWVAAQTVLKRFGSKLLSQVLHELTIVVSHPYLLKYVDGENGQEFIALTLDLQTF
jgi:hypothetical protein